MNKKVFIAPSILSANFCFLHDEIKDLYDDGATYLHFDVMDGHFVPNISFGSYVLSCIKDSTKLIKDVHLMISNPLFYLNDFIKAGADIITFHYESIENNDKIFELIEKVHDANAKVGISIKPNTSKEVLIPFLDKIDLILVMSVEPGFGGQTFIESSLEKVEYFSKLKKERCYNYLIEIDGGINDKTAPKAIEAGCEILVSGSYIFKSKNRRETIKILKGE